MTRIVILALLAESPPMEIRLRERFHRFTNFSVFSNNCDTLNADVAFNLNVMYNDWLSNINESVKKRANLIKEL